jgi:hypothetical protein
VKPTHAALSALVCTGVLALSWNVAGAQPMACCLPNGTCAELSIQDCTAADGVISQGTASCEGLVCVGCCITEPAEVCEDPVPAAVCINSGREFGIGVCSNGSGNVGSCVSARLRATAPLLGWPGLAILTVFLVWITRSRYATRRNP